jgi:hypothetical protein
MEVPISVASDSVTFSNLKINCFLIHEYRVRLRQKSVLCTINLPCSFTLSLVSTASVYIQPCGILCDWIGTHVFIISFEN